MWNWIEKLCQKSSQPTRKRVPIDIPFEQFDTQPLNFEMPPAKDKKAPDLEDS